MVAGIQTLLIYGDSNMAAGLSLNPLISGSFAAGTAAAERLLGTAGNDTLFTGGGADAVSAGAGNDTVLVRDTTFVRIDGGLGNDTFRLDSTASGVNLDLSLLGGKIRGFENFDLTGGGNNSMKLTLQDLLHMPDAVDTDATIYNEAHLMVVLGNAGDSLIVNHTGSLNEGSWSEASALSAANQSALAEVGYQFTAGSSYSVYTNGIATLIVDTSIAYSYA
jgi:hypothetical protein